MRAGRPGATRGGDHKANVSGRPAVAPASARAAAALQPTGLGQSRRQRQPRVADRRTRTHPRPLASRPRPTRPLAALALAARSLAVLALALLVRAVRGRAVQGPAACVLAAPVAQGEWRAPRPPPR